MTQALYAHMNNKRKKMSSSIKSVIYKVLCYLVMKVVKKKTLAILMEQYAVRSVHENADKKKIWLLSLFCFS
jgi:hypothetical protein